MSNSRDDVKRAASAVANRLRMVQNSFASESEDRRKEFIADEIENALSEILPDQRPLFVKALRDEFPVPADATPAAAPPPSPVRQAAAPPAAERPRTWEQNADDLITQFETMDEDARKDVILRLQRAGITLQSSSRRGELESSSGGLPDRAQQALQYLIHKLEIGKLDMTRLVKVVLLMIESMGSTDALTWNTWRVIAPRSPLRRPCELHKEIAAYISGDKNVSGERVQLAIETQRRLLASLIASVGKLGGSLSTGHLRQLFPEEIMAKAAQQGGTRLGGVEGRYWQQFVEMASILESAAVEHAVKETLAQSIEHLMGPSKP